MSVADVTLLKKKKGPTLSRAHRSASSGEKNLAQKARVKRPGVEHKSRAEARAEGTERQRASEKEKGGRGAGPKKIKIKRRDIKTKKRKRKREKGEDIRLILSF